uniref:Uncharacterized protein n=1 Tax=Arundo donax TaxID=35708 RepID=A0A0A9FDK0_ARUDO
MKLPNPADSNYNFWHNTTICRF